MDLESEGCEGQHSSWCWTRPATCLLFYDDLESGGEDLWARSRFRLLGREEVVVSEEEMH